MKIENNYKGKKKKPTNQKEFFAYTQTDNLLKLRYLSTCEFPEKVGDKPAYDNDGVISWYIDKDLLYAELNKRPNRVRAKDRRKKK